MRPRHKADIDRAFGRTMMWVCLCMVAIFFIAYVSHCIHTPIEEPTQEEVGVREARGQWQELQLKTLEDSIHEFEDGF